MSQSRLLLSENKKEQINEEGIIHYHHTRKFIVRVNIKGQYFSLKAFRFKKDAIDFYNNWLLENR